MAKSVLEIDSQAIQVTHEVGPNQTGIRLDAFLKEYYRRRSREQVKRAIENGSVTVLRTQGPHVSVGRLKPSSQLLAGDRVLVRTEKKPEPEVSFDYRVIFEDADLLVIEKPGNLPVHPAGRYFYNTLLVHLRTQGHTLPLSADREFYLVHRIDKETSGIMVLAKNRETCAHIVEQFAERQTEKRYLAIVHGRPLQTEFTVSAPMRRAPKAKINVKMSVTSEEDPEAMNALTHFKILETRGPYTLMECRPKTGRQHQIRVHLEHAGHPIVGDKLYGRPEKESLMIYDREWLPPEVEARLVLPRHALHAANLKFVHPTTGELMSFESGLPPDLEQFFSSLLPD